MKELIVDQNFVDCRLDVFVCEKESSLTRSYIKKLIEDGKITLNGKTVKAGYKLKLNDIVGYELPSAEKIDIQPENIPIKIIYEDSDLLVINKEQGMVVHPAGRLRTGTLVNALMFHIKDLSGINGKLRPGIVHRIDKDTSGLLVVAKNDFTHLKLQEQIQNKTCHRIYIAVCYGKFKDNEGIIQNYLARSKKNYEKYVVVPNNQGKLAITHYKVIAYNNGLSLVKFELKTGRTHQIRVHSSYLGHPIVGDKLYGSFEKSYNVKLNGQLLHAYKLVFNHPTKNIPMTFVCPLPNYFDEFLVQNNLKLSIGDLDEK